jgi:PAS domain S-box-containing protein
MTPHTVLIVEDNPITRKMMRVTLASEGYTVVEAADGRSALALLERDAPDLILQDLLLSDMDGFDLVRQVRASAKGAAIPVLAISGFFSKIEQSRALQVGFTDYLFKPVEPAHLLATVDAYLRPASDLRGQPGRGRRVLIVDDDPLQLKLLKVQLEQLGFCVAAAGDGVEALEQARACSPDAIISDVLMPRMDGFRFCLAVRQQPRLAGVPVLLISAVYTEEVDHNLAQSVGASAFILRTPGNQEVIDTLLACFGRATAAPQGPVELPLEEYTHRVVRQLEQRVSLNATLTHRLARLEAELGILARVVETLQSTTTTEAVLGQLLLHCLDAAGISRGAAYLLDPDGRLSLKAWLGYAATAEGPLADFFGRIDLLHRVLDAGEPMEVNRTSTACNGSADLLAKSGAQAILLTPLLLGEKRLGVLEMASAHRELGEDWLTFAKGIGGQISQALELGRALSQLNASEQRYRDLVGGLDAVVWESDAEGRFTFVSSRAEALLGHSVGRWLEGPDFWPRLLHPDDREHTQALRRTAILGGRDHTLEYRVVSAEGRPLWLQDTVRVDLDGTKRAYRLRGVMVDVTQRKQAEETAQRREALLRSVMEGITDAIFVKDLAGRYLLMNPAGARFLGKAPEDLIGKHDGDLFSPGTAERILAEDRKVMSAGETCTTEEAITTGSVTRTFLTTKVPYRDSGGTLLGLIGIARDVTEQGRIKEHEAKLRVAREVQQGLFPAAPPQLAGLELAGAAYPAEATGGDYFDYIPLTDGSLLVAIGDACGHGFGAALLMAEARASLRTLTLTRTDLSEIMALLNRALVREKVMAQFVTLLLVRIDPHDRSLSHISAGHSTGHVLDSAGKVKATLQSGAPPLGIDLRFQFPLGPTTALAPRDMVLLMTDGVGEAKSAEGEHFGEDRALKVVRACHEEPAAAIVHNVYCAARAFSNDSPQDDDITAVVIKVGPGAVKDVL